jgi:cyclase
MIVISHSLKTKIGSLCLASLASVFCTAVFAQEVTTEQVTESIYIIKGNGGNIGVFIGDDGTFMIDDKFAPMSDNIMKALKSVGASTPKYLLNTHFHGDHSGGNENFGNAGATIVAHHNVYQRLADGSTIAAFAMETPPAPDTALPVLTFDSELVFNINGERVRTFHVPSAHTDGDAMIHFEGSNVIHTGDIFFNGFYPFIDVSNGGSVQGVIDAANQALALANAETKIIPGHGPMANKAQLLEYRDMLVTVEQRLSKLKADGKMAEQAIAEFPLMDLEEEWGDGMFNGDKWIGLIYDGI